MKAIIHGSGGADLDPVTATTTDVRKGKVIVDKNGDPLTGTMPEIAGRTITPGANKLTVSGGGYLLDKIEVPGFAMPSPNILKKGAVYEAYGRKVTGTFQGWVGDAGDLYINGQNNAGFTIYGSTFQQDRIALGSGFTLTSTKSYTLTQGQKLTIVGGSISGSFGAGQSGRRYFYLEDDAGTLLTQIDMSTISYANGFSFTMPRSLTFKPKIRFDYAAFGWSGYINRIYI